MVSVPSAFFLRVAGVALFAPEAFWSHLKLKEQAEHEKLKETEPLAKAPGADGGSHGPGVGTGAGWRRDGLDLEGAVLNFFPWRAFC